MPSYYDPWDDDEQRQQYEEESFYGGDTSDFSIWKPGDPDPYFSPTMPERSSYRSALGVMATRLSPNIAGFAEAIGPTGYGADYAPAHLRWTGQGSYQPKGRIGLGVWGHDQGLDDPFPILGGKIITPTLDIYTRNREQRFDEYGRALNEEEYRPRADFRSGRVEVANIMQTAGARGRSVYEQMIAQGMTQDEARLTAERASHGSVRSQTSSFPSEDFGQRWGWPQGLRSAMGGAVNMRLHGEYGIGPKELFKVLGEYDLFTRATSPSEDNEHPERGAWEAYKLNTLYSLGWLQGEDGSFITGTNKPDKRRQLGVQRLAAPVGADALLRTGRLTGDRMLNTTAVFMENYPFSEGSGVADPSLVSGFRDFRPRTIERPAQAGDDWQVRFGIKDEPGPLSKPGESVFLGEQFIGGKWQPLGDEPGKPGVQQRVFGYRKTQSGYQALIESISPFESGTAKLMHYGNKALLFQSSAIINRMQGNVREAQALGQLPGDVEAPRMVLPMPKDWMQTYYGMFDMMPEETLRGMGVSNEAIQSRNWQKVAPEAIDKLSQYVQQRKFSFEQVHEVPVERLGAFENAGNIVNGVEYLQKGGVDYARFTARHTGYALPIAAGIRMEYPGHSPMYSPEELMQIQRQYPLLAQKLAERANPASHIWGTAVAAAEGTVPQGAVSHEDLPWLTARLDETGTMDETGGSRRLIENLAREMRTNRQMGVIVGPGGTLLPNPNDVLSQSIMGYTGQEQSQFVSSYIQAMKLMGTGEDATEALGAFSKNLQTFAAGHNVRRKALGATLDRAIEGTFTSHMAIPDDVVVAGNDSLRTLLGIRADDEHADAKFAEAVRMLEGGSNFYALGTRRPVSDMFNQLGVPTRVITEKMAQEIYGVEIENLGRSFAVSPTLAAVWRGDVDADRALLQGVTDVRYKGTEVNMPGGNETWYMGGVSFSTSDEILGAHNQQTMMARQVAALRTRAPEAFSSWMSGESKNTQGLVQAGLQGNRGIEATRALSRALHGIPIDWNESAKWSEELAVGTGKNLPHDYAYYADPANGTTFSREAMLGKFEQTAKSKMLMGRGYNRYLRGLTSLAGNENELQAAVTLASNVYQKALDNQKMSGGELLMFNLFESMGPSGAVFDKFGNESGYVSGGSAFTGGPAGMVAILAKAITDMDVPREAMATLFSRDPKIADAIAKGGNEYQILQAIGYRRPVESAQNFLEDPKRAGILPQLMQSLHYSKESIEPEGAAQERYAARGRSIRDMIDVVGRSAKQRVTTDQGGEIEVSGLSAADAARKMRNMGGLDSLPWWKRNMAARTGFEEQYFASQSEMRKILQEMGIQDYDNPQTADNDNHTLAIINKSEAELFQYLRNVPKTQWAGIMEAWRKQQGATSSTPDPVSGYASDVPEDNGPFAPDNPDPFAGAPLPYADSLDAGGNQTRTMGDGTVAEAKIPHKKRAFKLHENPEQAQLREAIKIWEAGQRVNIANAPGMLSFVQAMGRASGKHVKINMNAYTSGAWSATAQLEDPGLKGHGATILQKLIEKGPAEGYTPEVMTAMAEGFGHPGLGQDMMRSVRGVIDTDPTALEKKDQWRLWEQVQKIQNALGQDTPADGAFAEKVEALTAIMAQSAAPNMGAGGPKVGLDKYSPETRQRVASLMRDSMAGLAVGGTSNIADAQALAEGGMTSTLGRLRRVSAGAGSKVDRLASADQQRLFADKAKAIEELVGEFGWDVSGDADYLKARHGGNLLLAEGFENDNRAEILSKKEKKDAKERRLRAMQSGVTQTVSSLFTDRAGYDAGLLQAVGAGGGKAFDSFMAMDSTDYLDQTNASPKEREAAYRSAFKATGTLRGLVPEGGAEDYRLRGMGENFFDQWGAARKDLIESTIKETEARKASQKVIEEEVKARGDYLKSPEGQSQLKGMESFVGRMNQQQGVGGASWTPEGAKAFSPAEVKRMQTAMNAYKSMGTPEGDEKAQGIANMLDHDEFAKSMDEFGGKEPGRIGKAINRVLKRPEGTPGMGSADIGNMFTELTLGWTAFRMRMAWNLTTGAQKDWQDAFMNEEAAAAGAALAGGAPAGVVGNSSQYLAANAAIANSKAQLGQGVAQVYAPFMSGVAGVNAGSGLGAAATIAGTGLGASFLSAMGVSMLSGVEGLAGLGAAAGPVGIAAGLGVAGVLGASYVTGEGPAWVKQDEGSYAQNWRKYSAMGGEAAVSAGGPRFLGAVHGALYGATVPLLEKFNRTFVNPDADYGAARKTLDALMYGDKAAEIEKQRSSYQPGMLAKDADELRDWTSNKFKNTVNVDQMLQIEGSLFPLTGTTAQQLYEGKAPQVEKLLEHFGSYLQAGASPDSLFSSQMAAAQAAGVPLGAATTDFLVRFGDRFATGGSEQRAMYEQAYQGLAAIPQALGRPTSDGESDLAVLLTEKYGNAQRAESEVTGLLGVGWFTSAFGVKSGSQSAQSIGKIFGTQDVPTQNTSQQLAGMTASSFIRGGVQTEEAAKMIASFAETSSADKVLGFSNLVIQAESVSLRTGQSMTALVNDAWGRGYDGKSVAEQSWYLASQGGLSGLAPNSMLPGSVQAQAFEQPYGGISVPQQTAYKTAAGMLNQVMPRGFSPVMLDQYGNQLLGGANVTDVGLTLQAQTGRAGLASAFGVPAASPFARLLETQTIGQLAPNMSMPGQDNAFMSQLMEPSGLNMTGDQVRGMGGMLHSGFFQKMTAGEIAKLAPGLRDAYFDVEAGKMTAHQYGRLQEAATGSTPWGMSKQLDFGPGSLTDSLGRQYGMYEPWTATAGRQSGQSFAPLFDLQINAAYAGLAAQSAALPIEHRTFLRQQAAQRMQWGSGPFVEQSKVQAAIFPDPGSGVEPAQVGIGMQVGESSIGLVQQESAIRRQMWQENIAYQQQSIGFQRQSLAIAREEFELSKQQYGAQREYNLSERGANRGMQMRQREWATEDFSIKIERMGTTQEWAMEDLQRARRYSTGRERVDIERNIQRTMLTQGWERDDTNRGRNRELEVQRHQDQRYNAAIKFEQQLHEIQMQRFTLQEQKLGLQEAMLAAQEAHLNNQAVLQEKLQKIDEDRFKFQYEQTQAQMKDDETLEKLRQEVRRAEIAYQAAQLANAETLQKAQEDWMKKLEEGKTDGVLDKWIEFFNAIKVGPPGYIPPAAPTGGIDPTGGQHTPPAGEVRGVTRYTEMGVGRELVGSSQPTVVNFVLDGEVVFSAVVKPERLRPVVEEINRRGKLR